MKFERWRDPQKGALFVVTGASGTGKTTLVKLALEAIPGLGWSTSVTTRAPRTGEVDGVDYHFVSRPRFEEMREAGDLLEWATVYDNCYGTPRGPVEEALAQGRSVLLEIDAQGAAQVVEAFPGAVTIFVLPPDRDSLERRLRSRKTDSEEVILRRMRDAALQIGACGSFDYLVINDDLETAHDHFQAVLVAELLKTERRPGLVAEMTRP